MGEQGPAIDRSGTDTGRMARASLPADLAPVPTSFSLKEHTYGVLREAIMGMDIYGRDFDPRLDERRLADRLGISRTPVREALARLEQEGFVEIRARRGVYVRAKTLAEVLEMVVVWAALESMAARLVTLHASDEDIASLRELGIGHGPDPERADIAEHSEANVRFHQRILELSGCALLRQTADALLQHMHAVRRRAMREADRATRSVVDHTAIIEAIERREGELASLLVRDHTMRLHDHIRATWGDAGSAPPARA